MEAESVPALNINVPPLGQLVLEPEFSQDSTLGSVTAMLLSSHCFGFLTWFDFFYGSRRKTETTVFFTGEDVC